MEHGIHSFHVMNSKETLQRTCLVPLYCLGICASCQGFVQVISALFCHVSSSSLSYLYTRGFSEKIFKRLQLLKVE